MNKTNLLYQIKEEVINLYNSPLYKERKENNNFPVIGEGSHDAEIMFIGEAPGAREAATGKPFCGSAGTILTELLQEIGIERKDVYITNILKDRPPKNRDPSLEEIEIYAPFLDRQIDIIRPLVLVPLGRFSAQYIMKSFNLEEEIKPISLLHGNFFDVKSQYGIIKILILMHPAIAVYNQNKKELLKEGFLVLKKIKEGGFYGNRKNEKKTPEKIKEKVRKENLGKKEAST